MNLGTKSKSPGASVAPKSEKPKTVYPSLDLREETARKFLDDQDCEFGDVYEAKIRLRVSGIRKDEYGQSVTLEALSLDDISEGKESEEDGAKDGGDEEGAKEKKVLGYVRPKKSTAPAPGPTASDLRS